MNKDELKEVIERLLSALEKAEEPTLDMFACAAMQGMLAYSGSAHRATPEASYEIAKLMMEERKKWMLAWPALNVPCAVHLKAPARSFPVMYQGMAFASYCAIYVTRDGKIIMIGEMIMTEYLSHQWCPICNRVTLHKDGNCAVHMQVTEATNKTWIKTSNSTYPEVQSTSDRDKQYNLVRSAELLEDVADSGVEYVAVGYVTVQIDDCVWEDIKEWRKPTSWEAEE